tara:strand:+ start:182 stop:1348 length:1167 start_codon:yes stop_codon:yes gene_type:complete
MEKILKDKIIKMLVDFFDKNKSDTRVFSVDQILPFFSFKINPYSFLKPGDSGHTYLKENKSDIIFALKSGIVFTKTNILFLEDGVITKKIDFNEINSLKIVDAIREKNVTYIWLGNHLTFEGKTILTGNKLYQFEVDFIEELKNSIGLIIENFNQTVEDEFARSEKVRLSKLSKLQNNVLSEFDKDGNGEVDVVEGNDFNLLLKKHQKIIVEVDRNYVQQFVKVSSYLKTKKGNIQSIFNSIKDTQNQEVLSEYVEILKGEIHTYNLVLFNSLNMIVSLVSDDMITFYEIHEMFDTLNMFDSKHEKDVSQKLTNIGDGLESLMHEIRDMGNKICDSIGELSYVTEESNQQLTEQLSEIDSSVKTNNLLAGIQIYQMSKINKNTKGLRG